jgi:dipeptidyl aminopeptidase/acylaminoacyl peptidase
LLVARARTLVIRGRTGRVLARRALPPGRWADDVAWAPRGNRIALVRRDPVARRSEVVLLRPGGRERLLFTDAGRFGTLAWSPTGRRLLVPWREADQWLFLVPEPGGRTTAVANIARQFGPRAGRPAFAGSVEWCCPG